MLFSSRPPSGMGIVAMKLIKLGMDFKQDIACSEAERQVPAMKDHPHIGKVLDAGAAELPSW